MLIRPCIGVVYRTEKFPSACTRADLSKNTLHILSGFHPNAAEIKPRKLVRGAARTRSQPAAAAEYYRRSSAISLTIILVYFARRETKKWKSWRLIGSERTK
mgnify:CR=1 FL=1